MGKPRRAVLEGVVMKRFVFSLVLMAVVVSAAVVFAGWEHQNGKSYWVNSAGPATCWARDTYNDVYPVDEVLVYQDTIRMRKGANPTNYLEVSCGFWKVDTSEDFEALSTTVSMYTRRNDSSQLKDSEWTVDSSGDLVVKQ